MQQPIYSASDEQLLMTRLWQPRIKDDPEAFVLFAFPWGQDNTPLAKLALRIDDARRIPEYVARAWSTAISGRPGPVVIQVPFVTYPHQLALHVWLAFGIAGLAAWHAHRRNRRQQSSVDGGFPAKPAAAVCTCRFSQRWRTRWRRWRR